MRISNTGMSAILGGALFAATFGIYSPSDAFAAKGNCKITNAAYSTTTEGATTTSTDFVVLPKSRIDFIQGGTTKSCVIVRISAVPRAEYIMVVRAVIDGKKVGSPGDVELEYDSPGYLSPRTFEFVFPKIAPGKHKAWIEWKTYSSPSFVSQMYRRTVTVLHR